MGRSQRDEDLIINKVPFVGGLAVTDNGTANVTISNVAPSGVGTATIAKWLQVKVGDIAYYIPMWT